ncbi:FAD-binding protein [Fannyhessea vaginae]|uniref:FAD-dependent oxidoreductase n=1 Tax=Fannyhessea vaginae TaxID=82135 RepID=UPI0023F3BBA8|nr:FAD-binding protein [Fannyhessea vaginae]
MHASTLQVDVLVIGAGLAGTQAAYAAAQLGARVAITSSSHIFSGSSFSRSTYEMNVLKPPRDSEKDELIHTIEAVGQNVTDHELVKTMIDHIADAHENLKHQKLSLIHPRGEEAQTYIPSFDHRRRPWCKIEPKRYRHALERKFHELDIIEKPHLQLVDLVERGQRVLAEDIWDRDFFTRCTSKHMPKDYAWSNKPQDTHVDAHTHAAEQAVKEAAEHAQDRAVEEAPEHVICGALFFDTNTNSFVYIKATSIVMATGGFTSIFKRSLSARAGAGNIHAVLLSHGLCMSNLEFMQIVPAFHSNHAPIICNRNMFKWAEFYADDTLIHPQHTGDKDLLEHRSQYSPFTSRLSSKSFDIQLAYQSLNHQLSLLYTRLPNRLPQSVLTYINMLKASKLSMHKRLHFDLYAYTSNGGVVIDSHTLARTACNQNIKGLFAAGEIAAGMQGADRLGAMSSTSCIVFGQISGFEAATYARAQQAHKPLKQTNTHDIYIDIHTDTLYTEQAQLSLCASAQAAQVEETLHMLMTRQCFLIKDAPSCKRALSSITYLHKVLASTKEPTTQYRDVMYTLAVQQQLIIAKMFILASLKRNESRGSFYRSDFPKRSSSMAFPSYSWIES